MTTYASSSPLAIEHRADVFMPIAADYLHPEWAASLAVSTMRQVRKGAEYAYFVPAVGFIIDAAMELTLDDIRSGNLSNKIDRRADRAADYACAVAAYGTARKFFTTTYASSPSLSKGLSEDNYNLLGDAKFLKSLGREPIGDMGRLTGGSFRLLQDHNLQSEAESIIGHSFGLLKVAGCTRRGIFELAHELGIPYVNREYLQLGGTDEKRSIGFSKAGHDLIWSYLAQKGGCPSRKLKFDPRDSITVIQQGWHRTVRNLLYGKPTL